MSEPHRPLAAVSGRGVVTPDRAVVAADDEASRAGAAFETLRVYGGRPFRLEEHLRRLVGSAERLGLPVPDVDEIRTLATAALDAAGVEDASLRWTAGAGGARPTAIVLVSAIPDWIEAARAAVRASCRSRFPPGEPLAAAGHEVGQLRVPFRRRGEARRLGADDAVLVDLDGTVLEGPVTNIWWREGDVLVTPALGFGILAGETRARCSGSHVSSVTTSRPARSRSSGSTQTRPSRRRPCAR